MDSPALTKCQALFLRQLLTQLLTNHEIRVTFIHIWQMENQNYEVIHLRRAEEILIQCVALITCFTSFLIRVNQRWSKEGWLASSSTVMFLWRFCFLLVTYETGFVLRARFLWRIAYFQRHLTPWTSASKSKMELSLIFLNPFIIPPSTGQHSIPQDRIANSQTQPHEKNLSSHKTLWGQNEQLVSEHLIMLPAASPTL